MSGSIIPISRTGSNHSVAPPSGEPPRAPEGATGQAGAMSPRGGGKAPKVHESEFTKMEHLSDGAKASRYGESASGANREVSARSEVNTTDLSSNPAVAANRGFKNANANAERISEL
jgi:hypothetical protein